MTKGTTLGIRLNGGAQNAPAWGRVGACRAAARPAEDGKQL